MSSLARFIVVTLFALAMGMLFGLGIARLTDIDAIQRPVSQVFILGIFVILAHKAGWIKAARETWRSRASRRPRQILAIELIALCIAGVALGILVRAVIQGMALLVLQATSTSTYSSESRALVSLWQSAPEFSATSALQFALGAIREEIMYRYILLGAMIPLFGTLRAVVFSSVIFAAIHVNPITLVYGLVFAWILLSTRSLLCAAVTHTTANAWHTVVSTYGWVPSAVSPEDILGSDYGRFLIACAAALIIILIAAAIDAFRGNVKIGKHARRYPAS